MSVDEALRGVEIPDELRQSVVDYYHKYEEFYETPWRELDETHQRFVNGSRELRTSLFTLSYIYAVLSIQTPIDAAERQFTAIFEGQEVYDVTLAEQQVTQKGNYIYDTLDNYGYEGIAELTDMLVEGKVAEVVDIMDNDDDFKYIGSVKAPFVVAQLGYTSQMCVDSNVQAFLGLDFAELNVTGEEVDRVCTTVQALFPELMKEVKEPYHLQWILFNYERVNDVMWNPDTGDLTLTITGEVAVDPIDGLEPEKHDAWFDATLDDEAYIIDRVDGIFAEAPKADY